MKTWLILIIVLLSIFLVQAAEDTPPKLENHQFYGTIYWDKNITGYPEHVNAVLGDNSFSSAVEAFSCEDNFCSAKFGYADILRVQGAGSVVALYVDSVLYNQYAYTPSTATEVIMDFRTGPCKPKEDCSEWSSCVNGKQTSYCEDLNQCDEDKLNYTQTRSCGGTSSTTKSTNTSSTSSTTCSYQWDCTPWTSCTNNQKTRTCVRIDDCDARLASGEVEAVLNLPKPVISAFCSTQTAPEILSADLLGLQDTTAASCFDGILNQGEEKLDCGGPCSPCSKNNTLKYVLITLGVLLVLTALGVGIYFYVSNKKMMAPATDNVGLTLQKAYAKGKEKGMSKQEVNQKLMEKGWDPEVLKKY